MKRFAMLVFCIFHGACATSAWRSTWSSHPISESRTMTSLAQNARQDPGGVVFLQMLGLAPDDKPEFVCLEKPIDQYPQAGPTYSYIPVNILQESKCPRVETASQLLVPLEATQKLILRDLGIAITIPRGDGVAPYYTGESLSGRLSNVSSVERTVSGEIVLSDSAGKEVTLKAACCLEKLAFFLSEDAILTNRSPLPVERIPPGRVIFAFTADRTRLAYFLPTGNTHPQYFAVNQELARTNLSNLPVRGGLLLLLPVVIAVDIITAPIQIIVVAIVAKQAIETAEKFPRCLWP
ncbi:MAG: hypothetical protein K8S54_04255 [Spirochaetia bacterium]|nr:hypothetical protein [Spirochaetia bacterium]